MEESQQGPHKAVSVPVTKGEVNLRIRNLYFGNMAIFVLFVFMKLNPFLFFITVG